MFPSKEFDEELSSRISVEEFETWFHGACFFYEAPDVVRVVVPGRFQRMWIERHFEEPLREAILVAFRIEATVVLEAREGADLPPSFVALGGSAGAESNRDAGPSGVEDLAGPGSIDAAPKADLGSPTCQDHCFDGFAVGSSNRMAYAAALSVSESPGNPYNPLIIYGASGLGKSHLLQSCHLKLRVDGGLEVLYLTGEAFINLCKTHVGDDSRSLRDRLRDYEALVVDGVQWIACDETFQEIFALIVHDFCDDGRQLVLSCDVAPWEIPELTPRLASRLKTGLVTRLDPLSFELKVDILQKKAALRGLKLSDEIAETLGRGVGDNPRLVEGLINQLVSMVQSQESGGALSPETTHAGPGPSAATPAEDLTRVSANPGGDHTNILDGLPALGKLLRAESPGKRLEIGHIHKAVASYYGIRRAEILSSSRKNSLVLARQVAMYLCRQLTQHSLGEIGQYFGGRDHATVIYAVKKITRMTTDDAVVGKDLERISKSLV